MKLVHTQLENELMQDQQSIGFLIVEKPVFLLELCRELLAQAEGEDGRFVLSENYKPISIPRNLHFIDSPLRIEHNPRKAITALYKELEIFLAENPASGELQSLLDRMTDLLNQILLESRLELAGLEQPSWNSIFKFFSVSFRSDYSGMEEDISNYLNLAKSYLGFSFFAIFGVCQFLTAESLGLLCKQIAYDDLKVLFIESCLPDEKRPPDIRILTVDSDLCEIVMV